MDWKKWKPLIACSSGGSWSMGIWIGLTPEPIPIETASFVFFHGETFSEHVFFELEHICDLLEHSKFSLDKPTMLYAHGYIESPAEESVSVIVDAYLKRGDHNVLVLDWTELADGHYMFEALPNTKRLGWALGDVLLQLFDHGLDINKFHLIGYSLGGQLIGFIGRSVIKKSKKKVKLKRITGLDPAFPPFYPGLIAKHLTRHDAEFVDVIHTNPWMHGAPISTGTVDFWPNGGKIQPGCPQLSFKTLIEKANQSSERDNVPEQERMLGFDTGAIKSIVIETYLSSHRRSWWFWAESVISKDRKTFHAVKCRSWNGFKAGKLTYSAPTSFMGIDCRKGITGNYYLQTNGEQPFSRGVIGTNYNKSVKLK